MKVARITMRPCQQLRRLGPKNYIGYRVNGDTVEHYVTTRSGGHVKLRLRCDDCFFAKLVKSSYIVSPPVLHDGYIRFLAVYTNAVRRLVSRHKDQLLSIDIMDSRNVILTDKQRAVFRLISRSGHRPSTIARNWGVSRTAVHKTIKTALRKIAVMLS